MGATEVSHCFPLNGNIMDPAIEGREQVIQTYREKMPVMQFAGPTLYGPLLEQFMDYVQQNKAEQVYSIMLLITDGKAEDMSRTKDILVQLSALPASVIIVGVGNTDWSGMVELDGDDQKLTTDYGFQCHRDIVNFVNYKQAIISGDIGAQILKEVPDQVTSYMLLMGVSLEVPKKEELSEIEEDDVENEPLIEKQESVNEPATKMIQMGER